MNALDRIVADLARHLGSEESALMWIDCENRAMGKTPRQVVEEGRAEVVEEYLADIWGPSPV